MHVRSHTTAIARENSSAADTIMRELNTTLTAAMASLPSIDERGRRRAPMALRAATASELHRRAEPDPVTH
jgi:hypothetical protein